MRYAFTFSSLISSFILPNHRFLKVEPTSQGLLTDRQRRLNLLFSFSYGLWGFSFLALSVIGINGKSFKSNIYASI